MPHKSQHRLKPTQGADLAASGPTKPITKRKISIYAAFVCALLVACGMVFSDFLLLRKVYLFKDIASDSLNIYYPWLVHTADYVREHGIPSWTFSQGLGQNILSSRAGDYLSLLTGILAGKPFLAYTLAWLEVFKILLCGIFFFRYLKEQRILEFPSALCAFLYAFSGYVILGSAWSVFSSEALYAAILLFGFERWLTRGKWLWFLAGITGICLLQPFLLFLYAIFLALYIPVRYQEERQGNWHSFPGFITKTAGISVLGIALSAFQLLPDLLQYMESPRVGGEAGLTSLLLSTPLFARADVSVLRSAVFRAFSSDMLGTGDHFTGWKNYLEAPLFYCGIICLVSSTQIICSFKDAKQKIAYSIFAAIWILPIIFPYFRYAFWAFSGDYFRTYSLLTAIILLIFTSKTLHNILSGGRLNRVILLLTAVFLIYLLLTNSEHLNESLQIRAIGLVSAYTALLLMLSGRLCNQRVVQGILAVFCFVEAVNFSYRTVNDRDVLTDAELHSKSGYNDYIVDAVTFLKENDRDFFRIKKNFSSSPAIHPGLNDAKVQGYFGTSSYTSFNQINFIRFLSELSVIDGTIEEETRWAFLPATRDVLFSLVSGKYFLSRQHASYFRGKGFDEIKTFGDIHVYINRHALPFGFTYDRIIDHQSFSKLETWQKDIYLTGACVVENGEKELTSFPSMPLENISVVEASNRLSLFFAERQRDKFNLASFSENDLSGEISVAHPRILFFSIPFDKGWHATLNGADVKLHRVNIGFTGMTIPAGTSRVHLHFTPRLLIPGVIISLATALSILFLHWRGRAQTTIVPDSLKEQQAVTT